MWLVNAALRHPYAVYVGMLLVVVLGLVSYQRTPTDILPQINPDVATSQVISLVNGEMQNMPPGMLPPSILKYDASAVPVGNLIISSSSRTDKELLDLADHEIREELA